MYRRRVITEFHWPLDCPKYDFSMEKHWGSPYRDFKSSGINEGKAPSYSLTILSYQPKPTFARLLVWILVWFSLPQRNALVEDLLKIPWFLFCLSKWHFSPNNLLFVYPRVKLNVAPVSPPCFTIPACDSIFLQLKNFRYCFCISCEDFSSTNTIMRQCPSVGRKLSEWRYYWFRSCLQDT